MTKRHLVLVGLGIAIGFIITWIFATGISLSLVLGLLLIIAGAIIGFVVEWLIDESVRKNRELQRQLSVQQSHAPNEVSSSAASTPPESEALNTILAQLGAIRERLDTEPAAQHPQPSPQESESLAEVLRQHNEELHQINDQLTQKDSQIETIRREFEAYQQTHPDELTQIKGIGPIYQRKLRDLGLNSFKQLAEADPAQLRRLLDVKDWQRTDIHSWVSQARDWAERI